MKNPITTILTVCGALLASATTASAFMPGEGAGQICIFGKDVHCWHDPATYSWQKDHPDFAENEDTGILEAEAEVAMWTPTYEIKAYYCMKGSMGKRMQHKDATCIGGTPRPVYGRRGDAGEYTGANDTVVAGTVINETEDNGSGNNTFALMRPEFVDYDPYTDTFNPQYSGDVIPEDVQLAMSKFPKKYLYTTCIPHGQSGYSGTRLSSHSAHCDGYKARTYMSDTGTSQDITVAMMSKEMLDAWHDSLRHYSSELSSVEDTQIAFRGRSSTCSPDAYGRRSAYCNDSEVDAPVENIIASTEFGNCLLEDKPIDLESLVDCRSDACLGRKFYYGL